MVGGWEETPTVSSEEIPAAKPAWARDWSKAESSAAALKRVLPEAITPYAFTRLYRRLALPAQSAGAMAGPQNLTSEEHLKSFGVEVLEAAKKVGVGPPLDFDGNPLKPQTQQADSEFVFSRIAGPIQSGAVYPDERDALRIALAAFYTWRGDISYRKAGPRRIGGSLPTLQSRQAIQFYTSAKALMDAVPDVGGTTNWRTGLGLLGRVVDLERSEVKAEAELRLAHLNAGDDYFGDRADWPGSTVDQLMQAVDAALKYVAALQKAQDRQYELADLRSSKAVSDAAYRREQHLVSAADATVAADQHLLHALEFEQRQQKIRRQIASFRNKEAEYYAVAARSALLAETDETKAKELLLEAEDLAAALISEQLATLKDSVQTLKQQLPSLADELKSAQTNLEQFKSRAEEAHRSKEAQNNDFWSTWGKVIKAVGSAVSVYYTGVDLVSIADKAVLAYNAAESGDWHGALLSGYDTANQATGGKLDKFVTDKTSAGELYLSSLMADSLGGAAMKIQEATRISGSAMLNDEEAARIASTVVGQQAVRIGVSFLSEKSHLSKFTTRLGIASTTAEGKKALAKVEEIGRTMGDRMRDAAWGALYKQGNRVVAAAAREYKLDKLASDIEAAVGTIGPDLEKQVKNALSEQMLKQSQPEAHLITLLSAVRKTVPEADVLAAKTELLRARDSLIKDLSDGVEKDLAVVAGALDASLGEVMKAQATLPPAPLPREVEERLRTYLKHVNDARSKIGFLGSEADQQSLVNQIAGSDDFQKQLGAVVDQLQDGIADALNHFQEATSDLDALTAEIDRLKIAERQQEYKKQVAEWRMKAGQNLVENK